MDVETRIDDKWKRQFRKGFLELCVLTLVESKTRLYGFEMMESLKSTGLDISEGTLYPLLARLFSEKKVTSEWETPEVGHPRKFYRLSSEGSANLKAMTAEFEEHYRIYRSLRGGIQ